jgi:hypothetical protein
MWLEQLVIAGPRALMEVGLGFAGIDLHEPYGDMKGLKRFSARIE